jgi:hypothetical protein
LGERLDRTQEVAGSSPASSILRERPLAPELAPGRCSEFVAGPARGPLGRGLDLEAAAT